ncbi:MAG: hypothetical protein MUO23_00880, partial [Anaerolineales bacterium]|nr:hypothetical protein [Anaerolineales bacterium]
MSGAIVLGFFSDSTQVRAIARQLRSEGFLRSGLVHKNRDGSVDNQDPFVARRAWNTALGGLGGGFLATISLAAAGQLQRLLVAPQTALAALLTGVALGAVLAALGYRRARFGLDRQLMRDHARWLVADETVVILQVPIETLARAVNVLREAAEAQPIVFFLLPRREGMSAPQPAPGIALSLPEIEEHARRLAADHQLDSQARPSQELLAQLTGNWHWIHQASQDLAL